MERLYEYMHRQLDRVPMGFRRYPYDAITWDNRMLGLVGPRGVGKTTLFSSASVHPTLLRTPCTSLPITCILQATRSSTQPTPS